MLAWLGMAVAVAVAEAPDGNVGACAWRALPAADRATVLDAYRRGDHAGMIALRDRDASVRAAAAKCAGRGDVPPLWLVGAVASQAIQEGAAEALASRGVTRAALEQAWAQAPEAARQCVRANAAKAFGLMDEPCPDTGAPRAFIQALRIDPAQDRAAATHALYFMNAHAQQDWANSLIAEFAKRRPNAP